VSGTWMQTVAQSFLVLQLSDSGTTLGLATAVRFAPIMLFSPWGGLVADRVDKRRLLYVTQSAATLVAFVFGLLIFTHTITLWMVFVLATMLGCVNLFDNPARQAFISELVPASHLRNAVTLNSVTQNLARVFGGAFAGFIVAALGLGVCFELNSLSYLAVLVTLWLMSVHELATPDPTVRARGQIRQGLRYVASTPELAVPLAMVAVVGALTWEFQITLPLLAKQTFHRDASTYGLMASMMGVGAVIGGVVVAGRRVRGLRSLAIAAISWGASIILAGLAPTLLSEYVVLLFVGYGSVSFNSLAKTSLQLGALPSMRGRVMALWVLAWQGSTPIGGPIVGRITEVLGSRWGVLTGGIAALATGIACLPLLGRLDRRRTTSEREDAADLVIDPDPEPG
jgi:MFS family permease